MKKVLPPYFRWLIPSITFLFVLNLLLVSYLGTFTRIIADDFCNISTGLEYGSVEGVRFMYSSWSSRYTDFFLEFTLAPMQPEIYGWIPFLTIIGFLFAFSYTFYHFFQLFDLPIPKRLAALLSISATFVLYMTAAPQHIYWFAAIIPYMWSLIFLVILAGSVVYFLRTARSKQTTILVMVFLALFTFFIGGFVETNITALITLIAVLLLFVFWKPNARKQNYLISLWVIFWVAIVSLLIAIASPGAAIRRDIMLSRVSEPPHGLSIITETISAIVTFLTSEFSGLSLGELYGTPYLALLFFIIVLGGLRLIEQKLLISLPAPKRIGLSAFAVTMTALLLFASVLGPSIYTFGIFPERPLILLRFIQIFWVLILAYLVLAAFIRYHIIGLLRVSKVWPIVVHVVAAMLIFSAVYPLYINGLHLSDFQEFSQAWDIQHEMLSQAPHEGIIELEPLPNEYIDHLKLQDTLVYACVERFYDLEGIDVQH